MKTIHPSPFSLRASLIPLLASLVFAGCQSPSTRYTNGLILWCGSTAVGIGWGEYTEVAAGGKLKRTLTGKDGEKGTLAIDNSLTPTAGAAEK